MAYNSDKIFYEALGVKTPGSCCNSIDYAIHSVDIYKVEDNINIEIYVTIIYF